MKHVPATFNARAETVAEKPMFRDAFKKRRCIIPASGFFEWTGGKGEKVPHLFTAADGSPILAFAGLWDRWTKPESGDEVLSATIIVSGASDWMAPYHDRMPVLLGADDFDGWLDGSLGPEALRPPPRVLCGNGSCRAGSTAPVTATTIRRSWSRWPRLGESEDAFIAAW